jgi:heme/copper-type cytochrome/quinol oxidase subunit 3
VTAALPASATPVSAAGEPISPATLGMALFITTEVAMFGSLLSAYFYIRATTAHWPPPGIHPPELQLPLLASILLLSSSGAVAWAETAIRGDHRPKFFLGIAAAMALGISFLAIQAIEYSRAPFSVSANAYASLFFTITAIHGLHLLGGLCMLAFIELSAWRTGMLARRKEAVRNVALYWHFVDVVWVFIFASLYLSPRLG